jgi:peptide/nickel transport system permease protein
MFFYILKRVLYFIPTFFVIALLTFMLSSIAPGDPVELKLSAGMQGSEGSGQASDKLAGEDAYRQLNEKLGRNLPQFYFSITSRAYPDTLYRVLRKYERENLDRLIDMYADWPQIDAYFKSIRKLDYASASVTTNLQDSIAFNHIKIIRQSCSDLYRQYDTSAIQSAFSNIQLALNAKVQAKDSADNINNTLALAPVKALADSTFTAYANMQKAANRQLRLMPAIHWYGIHNQFHRWLFGDVPWFSPNTDPTKTARGFFRGDFGESYLDNRPVNSILGDAMKWTLLMNLVVFIIIYSLGIPAGVSLAVNKGTAYDRFLTATLFVLYSIPSFWIGTMLIIFFTSDYYGNWMNIFPPYGLGKIGPEFSLWARVTDRSYHLILPILCSVIGSFAYISRQMRGGMLAVLRQDYIRTAFAKGLDSNTVYWKHAFRNSLIPIITLFSSFLPSMISGFVIIEYLFTIPGMGRVSYESVVARNFPVLFTILMFSAVLTMAGTLLSDILYVITDPRISFTKKAA